MRILKKPKQPTIITVIQDDRERNPWTFLNQNGFKLVRRRLKVGDYTIDGLQDKIAIEKKENLMELLSNLSSPSRRRFERFLIRLSNHPVKCIIVCQPLTYSSIILAITALTRKSSRRSKLTPDTVYYWIAKIVGIYGIPILFLDRQTLEKTLPIIFRAVYERAQKL